MKAEATVVVGTREQGIELLTKAFTEFYGTETWTFTKEPSAYADTVTLAGEVLGWRVDGSAEAE